jgi:TonB family protein
MFVVKRMVLLFSFVFVFAYPLIDIFGEWFSSLSSNREIYIFDLNAIIVYAQPDVIITATAAESTPNLSLVEMSIMAIKTLYFIGVTFFVTRFIVQIISILQIVFSARKEIINGINVLVSSRTILPFSFFGKIVISRKIYTNTELNEILLHEQTHVQQWHSIDVILSEILCIFGWFNPAAWRLKREIRLNLEYLADGAVIAKGYDSENYQLNLLQLSYQKNIANITNNFNFSPLKKRIIMMNKAKTKNVGLFKYLLILPAAFALIFLSTAGTTMSSASDYIDAENDVVETILMQDDPVFTVVEEQPVFPGGNAGLMKWISENIRYPVEAQQNGIQGRVITSFIVEKDGSISDIRIPERGRVDPLLDAEAIRVVQSMPKWQPAKQRGEVVRVRYTLPVVFRLTGNTPSEPTLISINANDNSVSTTTIATTDEVFVVVEKQPEFPGGNAAMMQWLSENIRYPVEAQEQRIQGRVIANFVIEKDGSITDVQIVRGIDPLLDAESIRVLQSMPKWQPGTQRGEAVRVRFTLPLVFRLTGNESGEGVSQAPLNEMKLNFADIPVDAATNHQFIEELKLRLSQVGDGSPLIIVNGERKVKGFDLSPLLTSGNIALISIIQNEPAMERYGEKGVIEITMKR